MIREFSGQMKYSVKYDLRLKRESKRKELKKVNGMSSLFKKNKIRVLVRSYWETS